MNLIEQLGGYESAKRYTESRSGADNTVIFDSLNEALLQYRREHNIFERNDRVVNNSDKYSDELHTVSSVNDKALWFFEKSYGGFVKSQFRHATPEEIQAGRRLEVCGG